MTLTEIINNGFVVHCDTLQKAKEFLHLCKQAGIKFKDGEITQTLNNWLLYKQDTCYRIQDNELYFADVNFLSFGGIYHYRI